MSDSFTVVPGAYAGGLRYVDVVAEAASGRVFLHGAHVTSWVPTRLDSSPIWVSDRAIFADSVAIRGGVPICFPWFGPNAPPAGGRAHGLARLVDWRFVGAEDAGNGAVTVTFAVDVSGDAPAPGWSEAFRLRDDETGAIGVEATYRVTFGDSLTTTLTVTNTGERAIGYEVALHSYYAVSDIAAVSVSGLEGVAFEERAAGAEPGFRTEESPVRFTGEVDRLYPAAGSRLLLMDEGARRTVSVESSGMAGWVVWNPHAEKAARLADFGDEEWRSMVCLEPANIGDSTVWILPGQSHESGVAVRVDI